MGTPTSNSLSHPGLRHKFLSLIIQLPSQSIVSELVDLFFSELHWYLKTLEEHYFRNLLKSWQDIRNTLSGQSDLGSISKDLLYFPALLFQTLAVSLQFLPPNTEASKTLHLNTLLDCDRLSHEYSKAGMEIMSLLGRHSSTITGVEHDLLKSGWLKNYSRGTEAWHLLGSAIRFVVFLSQLFIMLTESQTGPRFGTSSTSFNSKSSGRGCWNWTGETLV